MRKLVPLLIAAVALAGCTSNPEKTAQQLQMYRSHAGAPINNFLFNSSFMQWTPLGTEAVALWMSPGRAYLLDLPGCRDLQWAQGIQVTQSGGNQVSAKLDKVIPLGAGAVVPCRIEEIRPLDTDAIRAAERVATR